MKSAPAIPEYCDIVAAGERLKDLVVKTPLLGNPRFDRSTGSKVWLKAEPLQHTGSFKFRGAANRLLLLDSAARARGVVAFSSGNHAMAVAAAAASMDIKAGILMPADAPMPKINGARSFGANVVLYDRLADDREAMAARMVEEWSATLVPPYDDADVIAGQGTLALEMIAQLASHEAVFDTVFIPCSGGGLSAGCALAFQKLSPKTTIYVVEPRGFDDTTRSLAAGYRVANSPGGKTICDALLVTSPGELTFAVNRRLISGGVVVSDEEVKEAMRIAFEQFKVVAEPGGAVALAGFLQKKVECRDKVVGVVLSGGNVNPALYATALEA